MGISALSHPPSEASAEPELGSDEQRSHVLADTLATKLRLGYEIESETEFGAVIFSPSPRRWLGIRAGVGRVTGSRSSVDVLWPTGSPVVSEPQAYG